MSSRSLPQHFFLRARPAETPMCAITPFGCCCEGLEHRVLLSDIEWTNRGSAGDDSDDFAAEYGLSATLARTIVDRAIADWERVIANFNRDGHNDFSLHIEAKPLSGTYLGLTSAIHQTAEGLPYSANIDMDDNGAGGGWYFDPSIGTSTIPDDSEFDTLGNRFAASGASDCDFYTVILHEIGHAMGIAGDPLLAIDDYLVPTGLMDPNDPSSELFVMNLDGGSIRATLTEANGLHFYEGPAIGGLVLHPNELMNRGTPDERRRLISDLDAFALRDCYGYTIRVPSQVNTFYANLDRTSNELIVRGDIGDVDNTIALEVVGTDLVVHVDDTVETIPLAEIGSIIVYGDAGDDAISLLSLPADISVVVNGNAGNDSIFLNQVGAGAEITLNGDTGNDTIHVGGGDFDTLIDSSVTVNGGTNSDTLMLEDAADTGSDAYTLTGTTFNKTGFATLTYLGTEDLVLDAGTGNNSITLDGLSADDVTVRGGDGDDTLEVRYVVATSTYLDCGAGADVCNFGDDDIDSHIAGAATVVGGAGADTLNLDDRNDTGTDLYSFLPAGFIKTGADAVVFQTTETVVLNASNVDSTIEVTGSPAGANITLNAGEGADDIEIGGGDFDSKLGGSVVVNGGNGVDSLLLDDSADAGADTYTLTSTTFAKTGFSTLTYGGIQSIELNCGTGNNIVAIASTPNLCPVTVNGGAGNDTVNAGAGNLGVNLQSSVRFIGGDNSDTFNIDDTLDTGTDTYTLYDDNVVKNTGGIVYYDGTLEVLTLLANPDSNTLRLYGVPLPLSTRIEGRGGDDSFSVGYGDFDANILGAVTVVGGDGADHLLLNDQMDSGGDSYTLTATTFVKTGIPTLHYETLESLELIGGLSGNTIHVDGTSIPTTVNGSGGDDTFDVGDGDMDTNIDADLALEGDAGSDTISFDDTADVGSDDYELTAASMAKTTIGFPGITWSTVESVVLNANNEANIIDVIDSAASIAVTVNGGAGGDTIRLAAAGDDLGALPGHVQVVGQGGTDSVNLNDSAVATDLDYGIGPDQVNRTGFGGLGFADVDYVRLYAGGGNNHFDIASLLAGVALYLYAGAGKDSAELAAVAQNLNAIAGSVHFYGEADPDAIEMHDELAAYGSAYPIDSTSVTRIGFGGLYYYTTESLELWGQSADNGFQVLGTPAGCTVQLHGMGGNDAAILAVSTHNLDQVGGPVIYDGGTGSDDRLVIYDDLAALSSTYTVTSTSVARPGFAGVSYSTIERLDLIGQADNNTFNINSTHASTRVSINGNDGKDTFNVNAKPSNNLFLDGGLPNTGDADVLLVHATGSTTGAYQPDAATAGSGLVLYDGKPIQFTGLENASGAVRVDGFDAFSLLTQNSEDNLEIDSLVALGRNIISGSSGGVAIAPLSFTGVTDFTLNTGAADGAVPDDVVLVHPNGLVATGLAEFHFIGGKGEDTLTVNAGTFAFGADAYPDTANLHLEINDDAIGTATVPWQASQHLASLSMLSGATATLAGGGNRVICTRALSVDGTARLDLNDNDLLVRATAASADAVLAEITADIARARNTGTLGPWSGNGITSTTAHDRADQLTGLAAIRNCGHTGAIVRTSFAGEIPDIHCLLVKYTYNGDSNCDGRVDVDDYFNIDLGYARRAAIPDPDYADGDFNYDGAVDADDYFMIDASFLGQSTALASPMPSGITRRADIPPAIDLFGDVLELHQGRELLDG